MSLVGGVKCWHCGVLSFNKGRFPGIFLGIKAKTEDRRGGSRSLERFPAEWGLVLSFSMPVPASGWGTEEQEEVETLRSMFWDT